MVSFLADGRRNIHIRFLAHSQAVIHLHDAAHGAFVTLPPYTSAREDEVQPLVSGVMKHPIHVWCLVGHVRPGKDALREETTKGGLAVKTDQIYFAFEQR
jgi:hypothetical protein